MPTGISSHNRRSDLYHSWVLPVMLTVLAAVGFCGAPSALADTYNFDLTDGTNSISFSLPSDGPPDFVNQQFNFGFLTVPVNVNGTISTQFIAFSPLFNDGGLTIAPPFGSTNLLLQAGPQLYTGT